MSEHYSKRIGRPFRRVLETALSGGRKRVLYLECGHTAVQYLHRAIPARVRCFECPSDESRRRYEWELRKGLV